MIRVIFSLLECKVMNHVVTFHNIKLSLFYVVSYEKKIQDSYLTNNNGPFFTYLGGLLFSRPLAVTI